MEIIIKHCKCCGNNYLMNICHCFDIINNNNKNLCSNVSVSGYFINSPNYNIIATLKLKAKSSIEV